MEPRKGIEPLLVTVLQAAAFPLRHRGMVYSQGIEPCPLGLQPSVPSRGHLLYKTVGPPKRLGYSRLTEVSTPRTLRCIVLAGRLPIASGRRKTHTTFDPALQETSPPAKTDQFPTGCSLQDSNLRPLPRRGSALPDCAKRAGSPSYFPRIRWGRPICSYVSASVYGDRWSRCGRDASLCIPGTDMERVRRIERPSSGWKPEVITTIRHSQKEPVWQRRLAVRSRDRHGADKGNRTPISTMARLRNTTIPCPQDWQRTGVPTSCERHPAFSGCSLPSYLPWESNPD